MFPTTGPHRSVTSVALDLQRESEFCVSQKARYRADIDGLRAIAVLSVMGYHYFGPLFPGGYVGVDIFFVISGYLLSGIIISEANEGSFSFARFYERRIRRIFPALFSLLVISTIFAEMFLVTPDLRSYLRSMLAASWSASNFYFWKTSAYFDSPAADKPLLHTWSLAVEEQFYVIFPIFVFLLSRYLKRYLKSAVIVAATLSFIASVVSVRVDQAAAFYLPFGRAWELLLGSVVFLGVVPPLRTWILNEIVAICGIVLIGFPVFRYTLNTRFPGEHAVAPCLGAAALIFAGQSRLTLVHRFLTGRLIVFIGLISYSLYLWHWPLLVFSRISIIPGLHLSLVGGRCILTILSVAVATLSWRFIETPFRAGPHRPDRRTVYAFGAGCVVTMSLCVLLGSALAPALRRFPNSADAVGSYIEYPSRNAGDFRVLFAVGSCFLDRGQPVSLFQDSFCFSQQSGKKGVLLFGDSEAANLRYGLQRAYPKVQILQATSSACPPLMSTVVPTTSECREFVKKVITDLIPKYKVKTVLLSAGWAPPDEQNLAATIQQFHRRGIRVVVFGPLPQYDAALPRLLAESVADGKDDYARDHRRTGLDDFDASLAQKASQEWHVSYVSLSEILCPGHVCLEYASSEVPIQFDQEHLTLPGSVIVGRRIAEKHPNLFDAQ